MKAQLILPKKLTPKKEILRLHKAVGKVRNIIKTKSRKYGERLTANIAQTLNQNAKKNILVEGKWGFEITLPVFYKELKKKPPKDVSNERFDLIYWNKSEVIIVELDSNRADQIAKKFLSRITVLKHIKKIKRVTYVTFCYYSASNKSPNEIYKYIDFFGSIGKVLLPNKGFNFIAYGPSKDVVKKIK